MAATRTLRLSSGRRVGPRIAACLAIALLLTIWWIDDPEPREASPGTPEPTPTVQPAVSHPPPAAADPAPRRPLRPPATPDFATMFETLVELGISSLQHREAADPKEAQRCDEAGRRLYRRALMTVADADLRALQIRIGILGEDRSEEAEVRRSLCRQFIDDGLRMLVEDRERSGSPQPVAQRLQTLLGALPGDASLAAELTPMLTRGNLLSMAEEPMIQGLLDLSQAEAFLVPHSAALLLRLWDNLQAQGVRRATEISSQALLYLRGPCQARRLAACRRLLRSQGGRFRDLVQMVLGEGADRSLRAPLFMDLVVHAEPAVALAFLETCPGVPGHELTAPLLHLASRDTDLLAGRYQQLRAAGERPDFRAELITATGLHGGRPGLELATAALAEDPADRVQVRALLAISAQATPALAATTLLRAIETAETAEDGLRLGAVLIAASNLVRGPDLEPARRVARRLAACQSLRTADRRRLQLLLDRLDPGAVVERRSLPEVLGR